MDVSVNKPAKEFLRRKFQDWYADQVYQQIQRRQGEDVKLIEPIDLRMSIVKPLGARWMIEYFKTKPEIIQNGF